MYSQCQQNHNDIHETSSSSTVTLCLYGIGSLVTIGCDNSHLSICLHSVDSCIFLDEKVTYLLWQKVSWLKCNMSWVFGWNSCLKPEREGGRGLVVLLAQKACFLLLNLNFLCTQVTFFFCVVKRMFSHMAMHILYWFTPPFLQKKKKKSEEYLS